MGRGASVEPAEGDRTGRRSSIGLANVDDAAIGGAAPESPGWSLLVVERGLGVTHRALVVTRRILVADIERSAACRPPVEVRVSGAFEEFLGSARECPASRRGAMVE